MSRGQFNLSRSKYIYITLVSKDANGFLIIRLGFVKIYNLCRLISALIYRMVA